MRRFYDRRTRKYPVSFWPWKEWYFSLTVNLGLCFSRKSLLKKASVGKVIAFVRHLKCPLRVFTSLFKCLLGDFHEIHCASRFFYEGSIHTSWQIYRFTHAQKGPGNFSAEMTLIQRFYPCLLKSSCNDCQFPAQDVECEMM